MMVSKRTATGVFRLREWAGAGRDGAVLTGEHEARTATHGSIPQVFFFPGIMGEVPALVRFRGGFFGKIRFDTVSYPSWQTMLKAGGGFEMLVELACKEILALPPHRPLRLAGYSFGAVVALALAIRLAAEGRRVVWLAVFDTDLEHYLGSPTRAAWASPTLGESVRLIRQGGLTRASAHAAARVVGSLGGRAILRRLTTRRHGATLLYGLPLPQRLPRRMGMQVQWTQRVDIMAAWLRAHASTALDTPIMLFRTADHPITASHDLGWSGIGPQVTVHEVDGDHWTMFTRRHEPALATIFTSACLDAYV